MADGKLFQMKHNDEKIIMMSCTSIELFKRSLKTFLFGQISLAAY